MCYPKKRFRYKKSLPSGFFPSAPPFLPNSLSRSLRTYLSDEILFRLFLKIKKKLKSGHGQNPNHQPTNRVRTEFRPGQTPKQLDAVATAVMTTVAVVVLLVPPPLEEPLADRSSSTGRTTSSPDCPRGGPTTAVAPTWSPPQMLLPGHHCRRSSSSTFRAPFSPSAPRPGSSRSRPA